MIVRATPCRALAAVAFLTAPLFAQDDVAALVAKLGSTDFQQRIAALRALQSERSPEAIGHLVRALGGFDLQGQNFGMSVLQGYPTDQVRDAYRKLIASGGPFLRGAAATALLRGGDANAATVLVDALGAAPDNERSLLLQRLYGIDDARVRDAVRAFVRAGVPAADVDNALFLLLQAPQRDDAAARAATALLEADGIDVRTRATCAAFVLALGETRHAPVLVATLSNDRGAIVWLARYLERAPDFGKELTGAIAELLATASDATHVTVATRVLRRHAERETVAALRGLLDATDAKVREAAFKALSDIPGAVDAATLRRMLDGTDVASALSAADTLRKMDDPSGLERVLALATTASPDRRAAIEVLGRFRARAAVPPLLDALEDADVAVRTAAFQAIGRLFADLLPYRRIDVGATGYRPDGAADARSTAVTQLRRFWNALR